MPTQRQRTVGRQLHAEDIGEQYVPPPNAYPDPRTQRATPAPQPTMHHPPTAQVTEPVAEQAANQHGTLTGLIVRKIASGFWTITGRAIASLIAFFVRRAQTRAEKAQEQQPTQPQPQEAPKPRPASPPPTPIVSTVGMSWWKQMYVYTGLLLLGYGIWLLDGAFTVAGAVTTILPLTLISVGVAVAGHFFLSWGQHSLIFNPRPFIKVIGLILLGLNAISNVYGFNAAARILRPELLGSLPADPKEWMIGLATWMQALLNQLINAQAPAPQAPPWRYAALLVLLLALALAWYAEKIRDYFHSQWKSVKDQRPP